MYRLQRVFVLLVTAVFFAGIALPVCHAQGKNVFLHLNYEDLEIDDILYTGGSLNVTVQTDPQNPNNKVAKQVFGGTYASTYTPDQSVSSYETGTLILEEKVRFEGSGTDIRYMIYIRDVVNNNRDLLFRIFCPNGGGTSYIQLPDNSTFASGVMQNDTWYNIKTVINTSTNKFTVYVENMSGNVLAQRDDVSHPLDLSEGISTV